MRVILPMIMELQALTLPMTVEIQTRRVIAMIQVHPMIRTMLIVMRPSTDDSSTENAHSDSDDNDSNSTDDDNSGTDTDTDNTDDSNNPQVDLRLEFTWGNLS